MTGYSRCKSVELVWLIAAYLGRHQIVGEGTSVDFGVKFRFKPRFTHQNTLLQASNCSETQFPYVTLLNNCQINYKEYSFTQI